jgi:hypothetical protein
LYVLDLKNLQFKRIFALGQIPTKRYKHSAVIYKDSMYGILKIVSFSSIWRERQSWISNE